jgi:cellulose synthase/poly-beta-1,6-N-acetylglucosamine synthase-like glycosyltransferase
MTQLHAFDISVYILILLSVVAITWVYQLYYYTRYLTVGIRRKRAESKGQLKFTDNLPPVSVVICARDATELLQKFLPEMLTQNYPEYEVIVVNDGANESTEFLLRDLKITYPRLRSSFVPHGTTNISTKKLALTLGIKAARYDWLLFTDAECIPENENWIRTMMRNSTEGTEIILGYGAYLNQKGMLNRLITYDTLFNALQYLGFANAGKPFMGVGRNLAYHKNVFFRNNGFVPNLNLPSGDDELFVNRAATQFNTRIESSLESLTWSEPKTNLRAWIYQKERQMSVSYHYTPKSKLFLSVEPITRSLFYIATAASLVFAALQQSWIMVATIGLMGLIRFLLQLYVINKSSALYSERRFALDIILFDLFMPLVSLRFLLAGRITRKARYQPWQ